MSTKLVLRKPDPPLLLGEDTPWPGYAYVISLEDSKKVLTSNDVHVNLEAYTGNSHQRWVCQAKNGWLGFTTNSDESTQYLGYTPSRHTWDNNAANCNGVDHLKNQMFCVRKRPDVDGFQLLARYDDGLRTFGASYSPYGNSLEVAKNLSTWWRFTRIN